MVVFGEDGVNVVFHGKPTSAFGVVPIKVDSRVEVAVPVLLDVLMFFDGVVEMDGMFLAYIFHAEVVDNYGEHDGTPFVVPQTRCAFALVVTLFGQTFS